MALRDKILIIGNGFDLYHELPTKYSQFIKVLMNIEDLNIEDKDISFDDLFKDVERNTDMKIRFDTEKMTFDKNIIIKIKDNLQNNSWYKSFKEKLSFENWIDVENEIKNTLELLHNIVFQINNLLLENKEVREIKINDNNISVKTKIRINQKELHYCNVFYLTHPQDNWVFDIIKFERKDNSLIKFKSEDYYENLFVELQTFTNIFNLYLESIVGLFYEKIDSEYASSLENLKQNIYTFYSFNYTPTLEKLYRIDKEKVSYLHGKHSLENHNIVLGIEEVDAEFKNDKIFMFTKYYQKLFNDTDYEFLLNTTTSTSKNYDFIFFGHSLAENDQSYIKEVISKTKTMENSMTVFYLNHLDKAQKLKNLLQIVGREDIETLMKKRKLVFVKIESQPFSKLIKNLPTSSSSWGNSVTIY